MSLTIGPVVDPAELDTLRREVLRPDSPVGVSFAAMNPPGAVHLAARDDGGRILGTCVVFPSPCPDRPEVEGGWQLRAMAVAPDRQGTGVGEKVLAAAAEVVVRAGGCLLWCNARDTAIGFYERFDFVVDGPGFVSAETGIPHHVMWRELPRQSISS